MKGNLENPSRRNFLKSAAVAGVFLAELSVSGPARAALETLFGTQEYRNESLDELLVRLEREVYLQTNEVFWAWVKRGEDTYAINIAKKTTDRSAHGIDLTPLHEDPAVEKAYLLHTHPAALFLADPQFPRDKAERIISEQRSAFVNIPSAGDIMEMLADRVRLNELNLKREIKHFVVDPSGVWTYDADLGHPFFKDLLRGGEGDTQAEMARGNWSIAMDLQGPLEDWQQKLNGDNGVTTETLKQFIALFAKDFGVVFTYTPSIDV